MNICYLTSQTDRFPLLSSFLRAGFHITLGAAGKVDFSALPEIFASLPKCFATDRQYQQFDAVVAIDWPAVLDLFQMSTHYPVILLERFWHESLSQDDPAYAVAKSSLTLPVNFLTTNQYVADTLQQIQPDGSHLYIPYPRGEACQQGGVGKIVLEPTADPSKISYFLSLGKPVITFATPETEMLVEHNVNGLFADIEDTQALEQLKETVEQDRQLTDKLIAGAKATAEQMPNLKKTTERLQAIFTQGLRSQSVHPPAEWLAELLAGVYQQSVFLHEMCETSREELHAAQKRENDAQAELAALKGDLEADRVYRYLQKTLRRK